MTVRSFAVRPQDLDRVREVAAGRQPPAVPRPAATVALVRDGADGLEVYLMRRVRQMAFGAGMHVFPGGSVEPADHAGGGGPAAALLRAAVRETLEECGVVLAPGSLVPLAHWVTPELEPRRYDTRFFLAALPPGQAAVEAGTEADLRLWVRPQDALAGGLTMMPPTSAVLADLARFPDVAAALAAEREIRVVQPRMRLVGDRVEIDAPDVAPP